MGLTFGVVVYALVVWNAHHQNQNRWGQGRRWRPCSSGTLARADRINRADGNL